jgi:hypothetical protein
MLNTMRPLAPDGVARGLGTAVGGRVEVVGEGGGTAQEPATTTERANEINATARFLMAYIGQRQNLGSA